MSGEWPVFYDARAAWLEVIVKELPHEHSDTEAGAMLLQFRDINAPL